MKTYLERLLALVIFIIMLPLLIIIAMIIKLVEGGKVFHYSKRVGQHNKLFFMIKFRTMKEDTPQLATDLMSQSSEFITSIGYYLRKYSLDELPQLINIFKGEMSFVGPRPALFNQYYLIKQRTKLNIHLLKPGLTGLAQVMGRDNISINEKIAWDLEYFEYNKNYLFFDFYIIIRTFFLAIKATNVQH